MSINVSLPRIALLMGDAAGIGPELVVRALRDPGLSGSASLCLLGDLSVMRAAAESLSEAIPFAAATAESLAFCDSAVPVLEVTPPPADTHRWDPPDPSTSACRSSPERPFSERRIVGAVGRSITAAGWALTHQDAMHRRATPDRPERAGSGLRV